MLGCRANNRGKKVGSYGRLRNEHGRWVVWAFEDDMNDYVYNRAMLGPPCIGHIPIVSQAGGSSTAINTEDSTLQHMHLRWVPDACLWIIELMIWLITCTVRPSPPCTAHVSIVSEMARSSTAINTRARHHASYLDGSQMHAFGPIEHRGYS